MVDPVDIVAVIVALAALVFSTRSVSVADTASRNADRAARNDVIAQIREWGGDVIELLSEAAGLCSFDPVKGTDTVFLGRSSIMCRLSASVDKGRLFFPNIYSDYGGDKRKAFRGLRPEVLDVVLLGHEIARSIDYVKGNDRELRRCAFILLKAEFVSVIQYATSFSAPETLVNYEGFLNKISVDPLPAQIRVLANAEKMGFQIRFLSTEELDLKNPGKTKPSNKTNSL